MTYEEIKNLSLEDVIICVGEVDDLVKECLGIVKTSKVRDQEIIMWIKAAILDLKRQGIDADKFAGDCLIRGAIVMYVKSNFGMVNVKDKQLAQETYKQICTNLSLSDDYKVVEEDD